MLYSGSWQREWDRAWSNAWYALRDWAGDHVAGFVLRVLQKAMSIIEYGVALGLIFLAGWAATVVIARVRSRLAGRGASGLRAHGIITAPTREAAHGHAASKSSPPPDPGGCHWQIGRPKQNSNMIMRGDPQPTGYSWQHQTLEKLMKARVHLQVWCDNCGHVATHSPLWFATMCDVSFDATQYHLAQGLVCSKCGSHRVGVQVAPS